MKSFDLTLEKYAELAIKVGVNIQPGQDLLVTAPIEAAPFVRLAARKAYEAGARQVIVDWADDELTRIRFLYAPEESFKEYPLWKAQGFTEMAERGAAHLTVNASNPNLLNGVDPNRVAVATKAGTQALRSFNEFKRSGQISWAIVSYPTKGWAAKVFPDLSEDEAVEALWDKIFAVTRVYEDDPVLAWRHHIRTLQQRMKYLNERKFSKLHYSAPGTDLTVQLPSNHLWIGGGLQNAKGHDFVPNMPTEEVFTAPLMDGVDGTVTSTKPLNYNGNLIENFSFTFEKGKVISFTAEKGYETLKRLLETDEGACRLGEVALVPHKSPVSQANLIFFNTLFDENASCHFALGNAYPLCIEGGTQMDKETLRSQGINDSLIHVDFMMGSETLQIDGETASGDRVPLFRNGNWVME